MWLQARNLTVTSGAFSKHCSTTGPVVVAPCQLHTSLLYHIACLRNVPPKGILFIISVSLGSRGKPIASCQAGRLSSIMSPKSRLVVFRRDSRYSIATATGSTFMSHVATSAFCTHVHTRIGTRRQVDWRYMCMRGECNAVTTHLLLAEICREDGRCTVATELPVLGGL